MSKPATHESFKTAKRLLLALVLLITSFASTKAQVANLPDHLYLVTYNSSWAYVETELTQSAADPNNFTGIFMSTLDLNSNGGQPVRFCYYDGATRKFLNIGNSGWPALGAQSDWDVYGSSGSYSDNAVIIPFDSQNYLFSVTFTSDITGSGVVGTVNISQKTVYSYYYTQNGTDYELNSNTFLIDANPSNNIEIGFKAVPSAGDPTYYGPSANYTYTSDSNVTLAAGNNTKIILPPGNYTYTITLDDYTAPTQATIIRSNKIIYPAIKYITVNGTTNTYVDGDYYFSAGDQISFSAKLSDSSNASWGLASDAALDEGTFTLTKNSTGKFTTPADAEDYIYTFTLDPGEGEGEQTTWSLTVTKRENTTYLSRTLPHGFSSPGSYKPQNPLTIWFNAEYNNDQFADANTTYSRTFLLGNGRIGLSVSGSRSEKMLLNDKTQYDGILDSGHTLESSDSYTYNALGYVYSQYTGGIDGSTLSQLDLVNGVASAISTHSAVQIAREYLVSRKYDVAVVHYTSNTEDGLNYSFSGYNAGKTAVGTGYTSDGFSACYNVGTGGILTSNLTFRVLQKGGSMTSNDGKINVSGANEIFLIISVGTDYSMARGLANSYKTGETSDELAQRVTANVDAAYNVLNASGWTAIYNDHVAITSAAMNASTFTLSGVTNDITSDVLHGKYDGAVGTNSVTGSKYTRLIDMIMYQMGRYLSYSASENQYNIASANSGLPFYLQGIWANNGASWRGDYHTNINFEMNYWPTEVTNVSSNIDNLTTYVTTMANTRWNQYAQTKKSGARGWVGDLGANNFGDLYHYWSGNEYVEANAWICESLWQHYLYTLDNDYLERIFPTLIGAAEFYLDYATTPYGSTGKIIPQYYSPEIGSGSGPAAHANQLVTSLIDNVLAGYSQLGSPTAYSSAIAELTTLRSELWDGIEIGSNGALEEWKDTQLTGSDHRHLSHLVCMYPLAQVSPMDNSATGQTRWNGAYQALTMRSDDDSEHALWNRAWKMNCYARALKGDLALRNYAYTFSKAVIGDFRSMCAGRAFQIDGNCGVSAGIAEMLVQSYNADVTGATPHGFITVAPALPSAWPDGSASGIKAIGNYTVDLTWSAGQVSEFTITYNGTSNLPFYVQCPGLNTSAYHVASISSMEKSNETQTSVFDGSQIWYFTPSAQGASVTIALGAGVDAEDNDGWRVNFNASTTSEWSATYTDNAVYSSTAKFAITDGTYTLEDSGVTVTTNSPITVTCQPGYKFASVAATSTGTVSVDGATVGAVDDVSKKVFSPAATSFTLSSTAKITDLLFTLVVDETYYTTDGDTQGTFPESLSGEVGDLAENFIMQDGAGGWVANSIKLYDDIDYKLDRDVTTISFSYARTLIGDATTNGYWQPLFAPVEIPQTEWEDFASKVIKFAGAQNIDGVETLLYTEVNGTLEANQLYIFMPSANIDLGLSSINVNSKPAGVVLTTKSTEDFTYTLTGNYETKTDMHTSGAYALWNGVFMKAESDAAILKPYRVFLTVTPRGGAAAPQRVAIKVVDPEETGIEDVTATPQFTDDAYYDMMGRRVEHPTTGLYIHNGKKVYIK